MNKPFYSRSCLFLLLVILLFIINRISYLNLPFYWDEAWSYATAVFDMAGKGLAIIPGDGNDELTRGHPLLFYFLSALWVKIFGTSLTMVHLFPLMISVALLIAVSIVAFELFDKATAMAATLLFGLQAVFLAQSTQLLPEVMLALWTLLTAYAYFTKKWVLFAVFSVLLVMTKETGMVLIFTLFLDKIVLEKFFINGQKRSGHLLIRELAFMSIPVIVFTGFMIIQKISVGYFLYPEHLNLAVLDPAEIFYRILCALKLSFQNGIIIFFILSTAAFIYLIYNRSLINFPTHLLLFSGLFIIIYMLFSSINFFTARYLLSLFPFIIILGTWIILKALQNVPYLKIITVFMLMVLLSYYSFVGNQTEYDTSLGYKNTVLVQKQVVNYAEEMQWQQQSIYSEFLMQYYLSIPDLGYLNDKKHPFVNISNNTLKAHDFYIFCSNENDPFCDIIKNSPDIMLLKRFQNKKAWVEVYGKRPN